MAKAKKQLQAKYNLLDDNTPFAVREAYGLLRTNILYLPGEDNGAKIIAITSAEEGSGKSTTIANLSLAFARSSKKVLLIDADMRCPRQHKFFKYDRNANGLSEYLAGINTAKDVILKNVCDGLDVIPSGHIPPSPSELVLNARFAQLMAELKKIYDFVFIDFPPIGIVSDAAAVAHCITGYLFVVRANHSDSVCVKDAIEKLENVDANILGVIFNELDYKDSSYGKGYSRSSKYARQGLSQSSEQ
jgi:capsular exopolysaccharide synthesis family protein